MVTPVAQLSVHWTDWKQGEWRGGGGGGREGEEGKEGEEGDDQKTRKKQEEEVNYDIIYPTCSQI